MAVSSEFSSYVPIFTQRYCQIHPKRLTEPICQNFRATVLFADVSGFTGLTEKLAQERLSGLETLTECLNTYFDQLITLINAYGGDIVKFAGDALLGVWLVTETNESLSTLTHQVIQCSLLVQQQLHAYEVAEGIRLSLKLSVGTGDIAIMYLGGVSEQWEIFIAGNPLDQVGIANQQANSGEIIVAPQAWELVSDNCVGQPKNDGMIELLSIQNPIAPHPLEIPSLTPEVELALQSFIPRMILNSPGVGEKLWLAEMRLVTVLFINLPSFKADISLAQAQKIIHQLQRIINDYEGTINKLSADDKGSSVIAAFGMPPFAHEDDAARGVKTAIAIQNQLGQLGENVAIGVTTGRAFCGLIGNHQQREYTLMGDVVNLSARLMQLAGAGGILCDAKTFESAQSKLQFTLQPPLKVKGKAKPLMVYRPNLDSFYPQSSIQRLKLKSSIVGRLAERQIIDEALQSLLRSSNDCRVLIIEGEPGIGKSRLVEDLLQRAESASKITILCGVAEAIEKATLYYAWRQVFQQLLNLNLSSDLVNQRQQILDLLAEQSDVLPLVPLLNIVLALNFPETDITTRLVGKERADNTCKFLVRLLQIAAGQTPKLIVLEDAHWLDSASWILALQVLQQVQSLLLVISTRPLNEPMPYEYQQLLSHSSTQHLLLSVLKEEDTIALACQRLGVQKLPKPIAHLIRQKAQGNPFFAEELVYALQDKGLISIAAGQCHLAHGTDLQFLDFPDTIQGIITSRVDLLNPQQQLTMKVASIVGRVFAFKTLWDVHPIESDKEQLTEHLNVLQKLELTPLETPEPDLTYIFKHIMTQEVVYNLLLNAQRRPLHRAVAQWYEKTHADTLSRYYQLLAHHWHQAIGDNDGDAESIAKAIEYLLKASHQATNNGMQHEAVNFGLKAASILNINLPTNPQDIASAIEEEMAQIQILMGERQPMDLIHLPECIDARISQGIGILLSIQPATHISQQSLLFALISIKNLSLTLKYGNSMLSPVVYSMFAITQIMSNNSRQAYEFSRLAIALDVHLGQQLTSLVKFIHAWFVDHWVHPIADGLDFYLEGAEAGFTTENIQYACYNTAGYVDHIAVMGFPLEEVITIAKHHYDIIDNRALVSAFHCLLELQNAKALAGKTIHRLSWTDGDYDEIHHLASIDKTDNVNQIAYYQIYKMRLHYYYGDYAAALNYGNQALPLLASFARQVGQVEMVFFYALTLLARSTEVEAEEGQTLVTTAKEHLSQIQDWSRHCEANFHHKLLLVQAELARIEGHPLEASHLYQEAADSAEKFNFIHHAALAQELAGNHHLNLGDEETACTCFQAAVSSYKKWGALAKVKDLQERFSTLLSGSVPQELSSSMIAFEE